MMTNEYFMNYISITIIQIYLKLSLEIPFKNNLHYYAKTNRFKI